MSAEVGYLESLGDEAMPQVFDAVIGKSSQLGLSGAPPLPASP
jgi:hypothetical protein